jgi:hypothetical protein
MDAVNGLVSAANWAKEAVRGVIAAWSRIFSAQKR